ncbi:MAG: gamma-glutamyl-gamma-aminobutyrate hydrolase family protein [Fretibacterium sp.]|nr:gamma-glutamyl-gamma-aminobutyrate hydrolase family protein [Fretibacterium sp.]
MSKPIIGIPGNKIATQNSSSEPVERAYVNVACVRAIEENGGVPVLLPTPQNPELMLPALRLCDGLLFPGGDDVDPALYGEEPHPLLEKVFPELDAFWIYAALYAEQNALPVLGICRGLQVLNVAHKGTLYQDLSLMEGTILSHRQEGSRSTPVHQVAVEPGTHLHRILGTNSVRTNSLHHQAAKLPGEGLVVSARSEDGVVEALESTDGRVIAVQWHPEEHLDNLPCMSHLFQNLCKRAAERRAKP